MPQYINDDRYNDSLQYDISAGGCDTQSLLSTEEDTHDKVSWTTLVRVLADVLDNNFRVFVVGVNVACVTVLTLCLLGVDRLRCEHLLHDDSVTWCQTWEQVNHVIVDLSFDLLVHCDQPKSCVAHAENLMHKQGYHYNFIIGDEDLVFVGKGYNCKSDALRLQMLITRYTWDPKKPVYRIPEEVIIRYSEVLNEGVRCGHVSPNYTMRVTCSVYGDWCGADNIRDHIPWTLPKALAYVHPDRHPWYEPPHGPHAFLAFDTARVYDRNHRLQTCNIHTS